MVAELETFTGARIPGLTLERAASVLRSSWPALDDRRLEGWALGFSEGFTRRANSVWMLGEVRDVRAALGTIEEAYRVRGLPCRFLTTDSSHPADVASLEAFGYVTALTGKILAAPAGSPSSEAAAASVARRALARDSSVAVVSASGPEIPSEWLIAWLDWSGRRLPRDRRLAPRILGANAPTFLEVRVEERLAALARVTVIDGIGVIDCLATHSAHRGLGYGRLLVERAGHEAAALGATACLAMVVDSNAVSLRLFDRTGFGELGTFRYLEAPDRVSCC